MVEAVLTMDEVTVDIPDFEAPPPLTKNRRSSASMNSWTHRAQR